MKASTTQNIFINNNELLKKYCTPGQRSILNENAIRCTYRRGDMVFHENHPASNVFFVESGKVELWKEALYTQKQVVRFAGEGDLMGYRGSILSNSNYYLSATVLEDSKICSVDKTIISTVLKENTELNLKIMLNYINELEKVEDRLKNMVSMNVREKVAEALLLLQNALTRKGATAEQEEGGRGKEEIHIPVSRQTIADVAGTCLGRVVKQIAEFRSEEILAGRGKKITLLRPDKLEEMVARFHL